jgi:hypothetical protein
LFSKTAFVGPHFAQRGRRRDLSTTDNMGNVNIAVVIIISMVVFGFLIECRSKRRFG